MSKNLAQYILAVLVLIISHNCFSQISDNQQMIIIGDKMVTEIKAYIEKEMAKNKIVGLSVAIVGPEGTFLSEGFGMADKENNIIADHSTLFPIASVTKTFTGIAVMQLAEKGLIDLDRPVADYIPELSLPGGEEKIITTRMLLTHHSGIHGDILYNWYLPEVSDDPLIYEQVVDLINSIGTIHQPGKLYSYSNTGYSLLGVLIHRVSCMGYAEYIRSNIFDRLEMSSSIVFAGEATDHVVARGYSGRESTSMPMKLGIPAGGIALTSDDAARYMTGIIDAFHGDNTLLKQETMQMMMTQQNADVPLDKGFAMGLTWFLQDDINEATKYAAHRGELPPYHSMMIILPEMKAGVFVSMNTDKAAEVPEEMARSIAYTMYKHLTGNTVPQTAVRETDSLNVSRLKPFEGIYPNVYFGAMEVKLKGERLVVKTPVMPVRLCLIPLADTTFAVKARMLGITIPVRTLKNFRVDFREEGYEKYMCFLINNNLLNHNIKTGPYAMPEGYADYSGRYKVVNMENSARVVKDVEVKINKNGMVSTFRYTFLGRHHFNMVIQPIDRQNARLAGTGYFSGDKLRWERDNGRVYMYWSGLKLEKQ